MDECVTFNIGKLSVEADHVNLSFNEHRKVCHKGGEFTFEYGTMVNGNEVLLVGHSIDQADKLEDYKFMTIVNINGKEVDQMEINYAQFADLFSRDLKSKLLSSIKAKYLKASTTNTPPASPSETLPNKDTKLLLPPPSPSSHLPSSESAHEVVSQLATENPKSKKGKIKLNPGKKQGYVINPQTGMEIKIGGPTYDQLCSSGKYEC